MKYYVLLFVLFISTLQAQVPQLQEWWRADNMGYGTEGMTWIDNFYNGNGALVISTPNGVQTWQLRYPWDTVNVFTWQGGNANIKTGDFNGDGVRDYIDEKGNVYEGRDSELPTITKGIKVPFPDLIGDWNTDGFDDVFSFNGIVSTNVSDVGRIYFGASNLDSISMTIIKRAEPFEVQWRTMNCYKSKSGGLQVIFQKGDDNSITDGYALYKIEMDSGSKDYKVKPLDKLERAIEFGKGFTRSTSAIINSTNDQYFISAEIVDGVFNNTNLVIYNLSNDKIEKLSSTRMDGISSIQPLNHSIDGDSSKDWVIVDKDGWTCNFYSGSDVSLLKKIGSVKVCKATELESIEINSSAKVLNAGKYFSDIEEFSCFRALQLDSLLSVESQESITSALTLQTTEATVSVRMHTQSPLPVSWQLFDSIGRCVVTQHSNQSDASITFPKSMLARGVYAVQATQGTNVVRTTFVLP